MENTNNKFLSFFKKNYQNLIWTCLFCLIIVSLVYSIVFMSNMWTFISSGYATTGNFGTDRNTVYIIANNVNNYVFTATIFMIVTVALAFFVGNRKRTKYYLSNFIMGFTASITSIILPIIGMIKCGSLLNKIPLASYGTLINNGNEYYSVNLLIPEGFKEELGLGSVNGITKFSTPKLGDLDFTIDACKTMVSASFVIYTLIILLGVGALAITVKKLIDSKKTVKKVVSEEEM